MKKLFYGAVLLAVAGTSFAFLPQEGESKQIGTMTVISSSLTKPSSIEVITVLGEEAKQEALQIPGPAAERLKAFRLIEAKHLNRAAAAGWAVVSTHTVFEQNERASCVTTYVLEKR